MGYESVNAQGLTAPVYFVSFLCCVTAALLSDRYGKRGFIIMIAATVGCIGYLLLATLENEKYNGVRYFAVWLAVCGVFPALCINVRFIEPGCLPQC
jgi:MFS family permease